MTKELSRILDTLYETLHDSLGYFYIKDLNGRFLYLNKCLLEDAGCNASELIGKTDKEACWGEYADLYRAHDINVMAEKKSIHVRGPIDTASKETKLIGTHTKPFYQNGEMIGVCGASIVLPESAINGKTPYSDSIIFFDFTRKKVIHVTHGQKKTLFYLLQGYPAKNVASMIHLSQRTIEQHIGAIRDNNEYSSIKELLITVRPI